MIGTGRIVHCDLYKKIQNSKLSKENSGGVAKKNKDCKSIYWNSQIVDRKGRHELPIFVSQSHFMSPGNTFLIVLLSHGTAFCILLVCSSFFSLLSNISRSFKFFILPKHSITDGIAFYVLSARLPHSTKHNSRYFRLAFFSFLLSWPSLEEVLFYK